MAPQLRRAGDGGAGRIAPADRRVGAPPGAADALGRATGGATFGWEHLPGAEHVVLLREQLGQEGEQNSAYRQGLTLPFAKVAALVLTLLGEMARSPAGPETVRLPGLS